ncbi:hypothetical protein CC1G_02850 [Coprinopsis cinerea okayama7|uniref:C2H2-type domain-containing protein n=1 Tax=Coprinopsis cinerea (strain Okayama-7 / 130 / ATCC MYA-4618 / FGSC 9003) TaxID=240176 RepID=A8N081_COPC7|nr:hypothetical protein CC1G_02850 [Coprinopsis cinerea okayama7\|eukprot:XP_001828269.2 hypothetical protein CC1G_02850 [Coprinopsis cinerea okayama7\
MAVLLQSRSRTDGQSVYDGSASGVATLGIHEPVLEGVAALVPARGAQSVPETSSREKKHACTMCHKRFDRPSTLRKHLLVHTGEKAFVCEICGRRFGVASNLNRHVKRCALKPVNMATNKSSPDSASCGEDTSPQTSPVATSPESSAARSPTLPQKRGSISSSSSSATSSSPRGRSSTSPIHGQAVTNLAKPTKRRRRAPSPSRWVPLSLLSFNLMPEDFYKSVQVPLPPVRRNLPREERDSWDENSSPRPYHPDHWKGVLPGPGLPPNQGLKAREVSKFNFGSGGGTASAFTVGKVMVF